MDNISGIIHQISISVIPILLAIVLHEYAHGWVANRKGDPTARLMGRLTLNPISHIDLIGTVLMPIGLLILTMGNFMFGYAKPVPVNFMNLRRPKQDMVWVAAAGPITNIFLAVICGTLLRLIVMFNPKIAFFIQIDSQPRDWGDPLTMILLPFAWMCFYGVLFNILLAVFNMIPIPPLDGGRVMVGLLPDEASEKWSALEPFGFFIIIFLVLMDPLGIWSQIFLPVVGGLTYWISGIWAF